MSEQGKRIDWQAVRNRLAQNQAAYDEAAVWDSRIDSTFERRAKQLATRRAEAGAASAAMLVQVFRLGEQRYGLELTTLCEVVAFSQCTPVPGASPELLGIINLRGEVRAVADLPRLIGSDDGTPRTSGYVLFAGERGQEVGLRVDKLEQIQLIKPEDMKAVIDPGTSFLKAFGPDKLNVLNTDAIFAHRAFSAGNHN